MSNWILCSDRQPTMDEIRANDQFICSDGVSSFIRHYSFRWHGFVAEFSGRESRDRSVIAWMPMPAPYAEIGRWGNV